VITVKYDRILKTKALDIRYHKTEAFCRSCRNIKVSSADVLCLLSNTCSAPHTASTHLKFNVLELFTLCSPAQPIKSFLAGVRENAALLQYVAC
jgi:hypothetical protein